MTAPAKRFTPLLLASLLLNVFLLGGIGGGLYHWWGQGKPVSTAHPHGLRQVLAQLPESRRHELRHVLRQTRADSEALMLARREARQDVVRHLQAAEFDRVALDSDLRKARDADVALRTRVDGVLADFAGTLSPPERRTLAESMYFRAQAQASTSAGEPGGQAQAPEGQSAAALSGEESSAKEQSKEEQSGEEPSGEEQ